MMQKFVMKHGFAASPARRLAMAVCACGLTLSAQDSRQAPAAKTDAEKNIWTIGIYTGRSPLQLSPPAGVKNPVLTGADVTDMTDLKIDTVAHPNLVLFHSRYYMFFTAKELKADKGGIGLAESANGLDWKFRRTAIREPFVLADPYVFQWQNEYYMIPESHSEPFVRLYRATAFPDKWEYERDLIKGEKGNQFISPTVLHYKGMWYLFTSPTGIDTLRLFYARDLKGTWTEHPASPIVKKDPHNARTAGRPFVMDGALYRVAQDCYPTYGNQVHAYQITDISPSTYAEKRVETPLVKASSVGWNK